MYKSLRTQIEHTNEHINNTNNNNYKMSTYTHEQLSYYIK